MTKDSILKEFEEQFMPKTYDSYQGWSFEDIDEVKQFISDKLSLLAQQVRAETLEEVQRLIKKLGWKKYWVDSHFYINNAAQLLHIDLLTKLKQIK